MENKSANNVEVTNKVTLQQFMKACAAKWQWFVISVVLFSCLGVFYAYRQQSKYLRLMSVLIKDQDGGAGSIASSFASLGIGGSYNNVNNELIAFMSPAIMTEVVRNLKLDMDYLQKGFPHGTTLYGATLPFEVEFLDVDPDKGVSFEAEVSPEGKMQFKKFALYDEDGKHKLDGSVNVSSRFGVFKTPVGRVKFSPNPRFSGQPYDETETIVVSRGSFLATVEAYADLLKGELVDRDAMVINLSIKDVSKERGDDILNEVLKVYTNKWIADNNRLTKATCEFIDQRLESLVGELGNVDNVIADFKQQHLVPDLEEAGKLNMASTRELEQQLLEASTKLSMAQYLADYVRNPANDKKVIPVISGGANAHLDGQIAEYNELLMSRNNLAASTSDNNPLVKDYDNQLKGFHEAIARALNSQVHDLTNSVNNISSAKGTLKSELSQGPEFAKYLRSEERQQKVKEQLYLFLLQKREENQLSQSFVSDKTRVLTPPMGSVEPVAPKKKLIVILAFMFGLILPSGVVYVQEASSNRVRSRKDLERMATPLLGEIPFIGKKRNVLIEKLFKKKQQGRLEVVPVTVKSGSRDMINEAFRIVRGNIDFMTRHYGHQVIMVTSFNPGSGKSFISYNLCASFAIKGKKVLLIDGDLRHGSASQFVGMPSKGITSYLTGNVSDWRKLVVEVKDQPGFYVLPIGHRPPNPAELLDTEAMQNLVKDAKEEFDYVFIDCPPVDVVVDTQILGALVNRTIFVVRAGLLEKSAIADIDQIYQSGRFNNITLLLNGTEGEFSRYGGGSHYYGTDFSAD